MKMFLSLAAVCGLLLGSLVRAEDGPSPAAPPESSDMKPLFNGKDLSGWEGDTRLWSWQDGVVRGQTTKENVAKGNTFLIYRGGELGDFELRLSFKIAGGNSGVQYRAQHITPKETDENKWVIGGYQAEVEDTPGKVGFLYHERGRGYLCDVGQKIEYSEDGKKSEVGQLGKKDEIGKTYKKSDWNDYVIVAKGNHIKHYLNGWQTVDIVDKDAKNSALKGLLALQIHAGPPMTVEFKNVRLKELK